MNSAILITYDKEDAINDIYRVLRPGEPPSFDIAKDIFNNLFFI